MAVTVVFAVSGFLMANWLARLPAVRDALQITPGRLGVILLSLSIGSLLALPLSGPVVHRLRPAPTVLGCAVASTTAMVLVGIGGSGGLGGVNTLVPALFVYGVGVGMWDVAMNVEGAEVEQLVGRAIMPWFHAGFSLGTVAGALTGAAAAAFDLALAVHLALAAGFSLLAIVVATRFFLPVPQGSSEDRSAGSGTLAAWREPRTILIGLMMLGMALAEGSANDWIALGLVDGYGLPHAAGAVGLGLFLTAMTSMRLAGPVVLARFGRVRVVRGGALLVLASLGVYVAGAELADPAAGLAAVNTLALLLAGAAVVGWGIGAALGFPIGISAASDTPARSAARVSVVTSIGYVAFLAGPPILGLVADRVGIVRSMLGVSLAVALTLICAGAARAVEPDGDLRR
ncbi:MAG: MFS transporter [Kineosporiaceae bacterium]|nr:MFS transporter [Kineosporiaceae bacterium]